MTGAQLQKLEPQENESLCAYEVLRDRIQSLSLAVLSGYESYCLSPGYYCFTGRNGLFVYNSSTATVVVCKHPNEPDVMLVYPELAESTEWQLLVDVITQLIQNGTKFRLARFTLQQKEIFLRVVAKSHLANQVNVYTETEEILDWRYPVYILDTAQLTERRGGKFERLRQRLHKMERSDMVVQVLDMTKHRKELIALLNEWAQKYNHEGYSLEDLTAPARKIMSLAIEYPDHFSGQVIYLHGRMHSYCVWEIPMVTGLPANELIIASTNEIQGLSEWQMASMCEALYRQKIGRVNVGGSETHGLDRFKRKFSPCESTTLYSMRVASTQTGGSSNVAR